MNTLKKSFLTSLLLLVTVTFTQAQVGVGTTTPHASAKLEVSSTTQGFLPPRMTLAQRDLIGTPLAGLVLWCSNCGSSGELQVYNGTQWTNMVGGNASGVLQTPVVTPTSLNTYVYDGTPQGPNSATNTGTGTSYTYSYVGTVPTTYGPSSTRPSDIGSYTVTVTVAANGNFTQASSAATAFSISGTVTSANGRIWMDRNLGASRIATSSTDEAAYGDYYQWGRPADGHQTQYRINNNSSGFTSTKSPSSVPPNSLWIYAYEENDWLITPNNTLWTGENHANNPCPAGFRIPTEAEWRAEQETWTPLNAAGAYASPLKLTQAGMLTGFGDGGAIFTQKGVFGQYQTQTANNEGGVTYLGIEPGNTWFDTNYFKSTGMSCRCIKKL